MPDKRLSPGLPVPSADKSTRAWTRRERLNSAPYLSLKKRKTFFWNKTCNFWKKIFFQKKSHSAKKCRRGNPLGFINIHSVAKYEKTRRGDPFETLRIFSKKSRTVPKKTQRGPFRQVRFCRFSWKSGKMKGGPFGLSVPRPDLASGAQVDSGLFLKSGPISVRIVV